MKKIIFLLAFTVYSLVSTAQVYVQVIDLSTGQTKYIPYVQGVTNVSGGITKAQLDSAVGNKALQSYVNNSLANLQNQYAAKVHRHNASDIDNLPTGGTVSGSIAPGTTISGNFTTALINFNNTSGSITGANFLRFTPNIKKALPYGLGMSHYENVNPSPNNGDKDNDVWTWGYNIDGSGNKIIQNEPSLFDSRERNFQTTTFDPVTRVEGHVAFLPVDLTKGYAQRLWSYCADRNGALGLTYQYWTGTHFWFQKEDGTPFIDINANNNGSTQIRLQSESPVLSFEGINGNAMANTSGAVFMRYNNADVLASTANGVGGNNTLHIGGAGYNTLQTTANNLFLGAGTDKPVNIIPPGGKSVYVTNLATREMKFTNFDANGNPYEDVESFAIRKRVKGNSFNIFFSGNEYRVPFLGANGRAMNVGEVNEYPNNQAALNAGKVPGDVYRTGEFLKVVY